MTRNSPPTGAPLVSRRWAKSGVARAVAPVVVTPHHNVAATCKGRHVRVDLGAVGVAVDLDGVAEAAADGVEAAPEDG